MHWNPFDILEAAIACAVYVAITLAWVHFSSQTRVPRSRHNSFVIAARLILMHFVIFGVFCVCLGIPVNFVLVTLTILFVLTPFATTDDDSGLAAVGGDPAALAFGVTILLPVYILKQIVLGFPERDNFVLGSPTTPLAFKGQREIIQDLTVLNNEFATVVATLKPMGKIECNGIRYNATSFDGAMIDVGQRVRICRCSNGLLEVCRIEAIPVNSLPESQSPAG